MPIGIIGHQLRAQAEVPNFEHVILEGKAELGLKCHPLAVQGSQGIPAPSKPPMDPRTRSKWRSNNTGGPSPQPASGFARDRGLAGTHLRVNGYASR
jgi:hypothetical protein